MSRNLMVTVLLFLAALVALAAIPPYDRNADPFKELSASKRTAKIEGKNILVFVGGDWCDWCARLDKFIMNDPELTSIAEKNYVMMKVYVDRDLAPNGLFLTKYPTPPGFPHLYILDQEGELLISQKTDTLEKGQSYDKEKVKKFLLEHAMKK